MAVTATVWAALSVASSGRESEILCVRVDDTLKTPIVLVALSLALARPLSLEAQSLGARPVACKGQTISRIEIHTRPPFEIIGSRVQQRLAREVTARHATTSPDIIRSFLALEPGEPCTELRRSESERILRAQPYLANASVLAFPDENGAVSISVVTIDEISLILGGGVSGKSPVVRKFRIGEANLMGQAISLDGDWRYNSDFDDAFVVRFVDYQVLGKPYQLHLDIGRRERGEDWGAEASHPFLTDLQRVSWNHCRLARHVLSISAARRTVLLSPVRAVVWRHRRCRAHRTARATRTGGGIGILRARNAGQHADHAGAVDSRARASRRHAALGQVHLAQNHAHQRSLRATRRSLHTGIGVRVARRTSGRPQRV